MQNKQNIISANIIHAGCISADRIACGSITSAKFDTSLKIAVEKTKPLLQQCPCCGSRRFESEICIYCNTPRF